MNATRILHVDAAGSALFGLLLLADGAALAAHVGLSSTTPLAAVGVFLLAFAAMLVAVARRRPIPRPLLLGLAAGDLLWVVACAAVLVFAWNDMTPLGRAMVGVSALWGEAMGWLKYRAAGRAFALAHA